MTSDFWRGRRVFITGHTGFKGSWLALWLQSLGADIHGYSLVPPTETNLFDISNVESGLASNTVGDVLDRNVLASSLSGAAPEIVFHLAAQSLVRRSYADPVETFAVNTLGTVHLLEAARACDSVRVIVNVTTDKCYENREWVWSYRETEKLGGHDPYSSSKACSELVTQAYRQSFFSQRGVAVATARAGNVIGGGDWAADRLIPDFFRAIDMGRVLEVRHPDATRPWQHVLEPIRAYLTLAEALFERGQQCAQAWNFGPSDEGIRPVRWILDYLGANFDGASWRHIDESHVHEANLLKLDSSKAAAQLNWRPKWRLGRALDRTADWHRAWLQGADMRAVCLAQIAEHESTDALA